MRNKITPTLFLLMLSFTAFSQRSFEQFSIEGGFGFNAATKPSSSGFNHFEGGLRYMWNEYWGAKGDIAFDTFDARMGSFPTNGGAIGNNTNPDAEAGTKYYRTSLQLVYNFGRAIYMPDYTNGYVNMLIHGGLGYSVMTSKLDYRPGTDSMGNIIVGITPQIWLSESVALHGDLSAIFNLSQQFEFTGEYPDGSGPNKTFSSNIFTGSIGITVYLGRNRGDNDWR
jgi:OOP family OmpA-OmpF porin